ncbi:hypothetical protein AJ80_06852 [Polytolypa hystricis UAMH7299]|uniref:DUF6590 domain-containing protein n=1 Tax=Polytolypa hystricis (strain UAMH7299) TaxID=1447883 RepID=A0A2B7XTN2_POLH7|nr:hypothetical protein AJ80_06852 [Polytolypa hystricis UAMH7299]
MSYGYANYSDGQRNTPYNTPGHGANGYHGNPHYPATNALAQRDHQRPEDPRYDGSEASERPEPEPERDPWAYDRAHQGWGQSNRPGTLPTIEYQSNGPLYSSVPPQHDTVDVRATQYQQTWRLVPCTTLHSPTNLGYIQQASYATGQCAAYNDVSHENEEEREASTINQWQTNPAAPNTNQWQTAAKTNTAYENEMQNETSETAELAMDPRAPRTRRQQPTAHTHAPRERELETVTSGMGGLAVEPRPRNTGRHEYSSSGRQRSEPEPAVPITRISGNGERRDMQLDPSYTVQGKGFFKEGRVCEFSTQLAPYSCSRFQVFSLVWYEPSGNNGTVISRRPSLLGQKAYGSIRRMVVVREQHGCCWCLAIHTYSGRGLNKRGIDVSSHAVIHMEGCPPDLDDRAAKKKLTKEPIVVRAGSSLETLDPNSTINFGKLYTVEDNLKVKKIGSIVETSMPTLLKYFKQSCGVSSDGKTRQTRG